MHRYLIRSVMPLAIMIMERKSAWIPFSAVKMRWQTISPDMCGWHFLAVCFMASVSLVGAISPISCRDRRLGFGASMELVKALFHSMSLKEIFRMGVAISKGGTSLEDRMKKAKKPCIFVGMVCVLEAFQGLGYMRKVMEAAYAEGNRLQVPVILETDAKSKCDKYRHLGMQLEGIRDLGAYGKMYDMIKYPD